MRTSGRRRRPPSLLARRPKVQSTGAYMAGVALLSVAGALFASTVVAALDGGRALGPLAAACLVAGGTGVGLRRWTEAPRTLPARGMHGAVLLGWATLLASGTAVYLASGATTSVAVAALESTAGFTTTARSVLPDLDGLPRGVLFFRASTQWLGGFAALVVVVAVLPTLGVGGSLEGDLGRSDRSRLHLRSPRIGAAVRRLGLAYLALSGIGLVLFLLAGMGVFDAVTYAMTTISTGGFGNHTGTISAFHSSLVEWVMAGGMLLGGLNLALVLNAIRGHPGPLWRSAELRAYGLLVAASTAVLAVWVAPEADGAAGALRTALFSTSSALSTTGHALDGWAGWPDGPFVLLVLLAAIGSMSGAAGGGFRIVRAMVMVKVVARETRAQLHPRSVIVVKVGDEAVAESTVSNMVGYQVAWVGLAGLGAVALAMTGLDVRSAVVGATSTLATWGPGLGDLTAGATVGLGTVAVMAPLMLAGRLEISPLAVGLSTAAESLTGPPAPREARR